MTKCTYCKTDITEPIKQFGDTRYPICQSCWTCGRDWIIEDKEILELLSSGYEIDQAIKIINDDHISELAAFAQDFWEMIHSEEAE